MIIYIEYVLMDNCVMNYLIIHFLEITLKYKIKKINKFLACFIGTILTLFLPYLYTNVILLFIYKILLSLFIVVLLKKYKSVKNFISYYLIFITYTFLLGGIIWGVINLFEIDYTISGIMFYSFEFPIGLFVLITLTGVYLCKYLISFLRKQLHKSSLLYPIKLFSNNECVEGVGFYDSGNTLEVDGEYVSIISLSLFSCLYSDISIEKILLRRIEGLKNIKYITINGLRDNGSYLSFILDKMIVGDKELKNIRVAVAIKNFNKFDCILNSNCIN